LRSEPVRRASRKLGAATLAVVALASCEIAKIQLPISPSTVVIHGVLTPATPVQTVLVERTLTGEVAVPIVFPFDGSEPILGDYGNAESGATTQLTTPSGQIIAGREVASFSANGHGAGTYQFALAGSALIPGGRYQLRIETTHHEVVTAETVVPAGALVTTGATFPFDRVNDTLALAWSRLAPARGYQVRIESPFGPWIAFTDSTHIALTGTLRNLLVDNLPNLFLPGFRQIVTVSAVDANMYDYYRSNNNAFTGTGIVSHVSGGTGVFGSLVTFSRRTLDVTAPTTRPSEGTFSLVLGSLGYLYGGVADATSVTLYVESPSVRADEPDEITGSYRTSGGRVAAVVGTLSGSRLRIAFLNDQLLADTLDHFTADLRGDTLDGVFSKGAPGRYVRHR
jgi:hypothetical protein